MNHHTYSAPATLSSVTCRLSHPHRHLQWLAESGPVDSFGRRAVGVRIQHHTTAQLQSTTIFTMIASACMTPPCGFTNFVGGNFYGPQVLDSVSVLRRLDATREFKPPAMRLGPRTEESYEHIDTKYLTELDLKHLLFRRSPRSNIEAPKMHNRSRR